MENVAHLMYNIIVVIYKYSMFKILN